MPQNGYRSLCSKQEILILSNVIVNKGSNVQKIDNGYVVSAHSQTPDGGKQIIRYVKFLAEADDVIDAFFNPPTIITPVTQIAVPQTKTELKVVE